MKLLLKDFQKPAVEDLVVALRGAARDAPKPLQAVSLSAATGSGKTVIATAAIETILEGDETHAAQPEAAFLWVTDQPELNEQTRRKMLDASSVLTDDRLTVISATFDEEMLKPGCVHFLNIQKLGKEKSLVSRGDDRTFTIWDTITNTVEARPGLLPHHRRGPPRNGRERERAEGRCDHHPEVHQGLSRRDPAGPSRVRHLGDTRAVQ